MTLIVQMFMCVLIISSLLTIFGVMTSKKTLDYLEKLSPFECGFSVKMFHRSLFSIQFFLIAIIFIIFDVELVILFPILSILPMNITNNMVSIFVLVIILLTLGLLWEWTQSMLEWTL